MPTENQAKRAMQGAMEYEAKKWQLVVDGLNERIAELEQTVKELETQLNKGDK
jgi:uncharacterized small protein (DUF1192 family)